MRKRWLWGLKHGTWQRDLGDQPLAATLSLRDFSCTGDDSVPRHNIEFFLEGSRGTDDKGREICWLGNLAMDDELKIGTELLESFEVTKAPQLAWWRTQPFPPNAKRVGEVIESLPPRQKVHGHNKILWELVEFASESSDEATSSFCSWIVVVRLPPLLPLLMPLPLRRQVSSQIDCGSSMLFRRLPCYPKEMQLPIAVGLRRWGLEEVIYITSCSRA